MKNIILLSLFLLSLSSIVTAQDIIKPKKGEDIKARVVSTSGDEVEYKLFYFQEGNSFKLPKNEIASIKYADGHSEIFDAPVTNSAGTAAGSLPVAGSAGSGSAEVNKAFDKLNTQIEQLNVGLTKQTQSLVETLNILNSSITSLKTSLEQGNNEAKKQSEKTVEKLEALNSSVKQANEVPVNTPPAENEIKPRKFGMGVSFITNYLLANFYPGDENADMHNANEDAYKGLFFGAGFNLVISTRMDKKVGFRYEPEFSVASRFSSQKDGAYINTQRSSIFSFGSRFLGVARRNRVNIYAGPSLTILGVVNSSKINGTTATTANIGAGFGLHFGGEYLVHSNFGINMESGMQLYGLFPKGGYAEGIFSTYARLGGRFYF